MHKNFYRVMRGIGQNYTLRPTDIASIPKSMQNTNSWDIKKTNEENSKHRPRNTRNRTSFNEVQKDSIFLNNQKIENRSIHFIILSWSWNNEKNSNFRIQHERSAMKWKNQRKEIVQNQLHQYLKCKTLHGYIHSRLQNISRLPILMKDSLRRY